jgi:hypothetical protein
MGSAKKHGEERQRCDPLLIHKGGIWTMKELMVI